jgi:hypothetical protein
MVDDLDMTHARLDRLAHLAHRALSAPLEDRARTERTIQLICRALHTPLVRDRPTRDGLFNPGEFVGYPNS